MMCRALLLILLTASVAFACDRSPKSKFYAFEGFLAKATTDLTTPIDATAAARTFDTRNRDRWRLILARLESLIDSLDAARSGCRPAGTGASAPSAPQDRLDPALFGRLQSEIETASEALKTEIAQLDPLGSQSALFLPARRLNRTIRTVLLSTLEISCGTRAIFDARLRSARRQLQEMRKYLAQL